MCSTFDPSLPTMIHTLSLHDALPIYHRQFLHGFKAAIKILPHNFTQPLNSSLKMRLGDLDLAGCKFSLAKTQKHQSLKDMIFRKCAALLKSAPVHLQRFIGAAELPIGIAQVVACTN